MNSLSVPCQKTELLPSELSQEDSEDHLRISSLTLVVYFPGLYTLTMRLTHALPELAQCLGGSKEKFRIEEILD